MTGPPVLQAALERAVLNGAGLGAAPRKLPDVLALHDERFARLSIADPTNPARWGGAPELSALSDVVDAPPDAAPRAAR